MSGNNVAQVIAANPLITGGFYSAPLGTALPTTSGVALNMAFIPLGYIGDNGVTQTSQRQITDVNAWGGDLVATLQDKFDITIKLDFLQALDADVKKAVFHTDNVTVTPSTPFSGTEIKVLHNSKLLETRSWSIESYYDAATMRLIMPRGRIVEVGDIKYSHKELTMYAATLKLFPDTSGNHAYEYDNDGVVTAT
jgi:hypothetical protein